MVKVCREWLTILLYKRNGRYAWTRARIFGVQDQMRKFDFLFGVMLGAWTLKQIDSLSKTMQHKDVSATEAQEVAKLTITTLQSL